jgi:hypothetical protein
LRTKRSIFEKLGLVEFKVNEEKLDSVTESDLDLKDELYNTVETVIDEYKLDEKVDVNDLKVDKSEHQKEGNDQLKQDKESGIEEKLDELIGTFDKNKLLSIEEIYSNYRLSTDVKNTIFMVDDLMKALPENLTLDIKRESLMSIMKVSNIEKDDLLNDAYKRMDALNTVLKDTVQTTEDIITRNDRSIKELEKRIEDLKNVTEKRIKFKEDQNTMIDYEVQKIINIVEFVKPKK